MIEAMLTGGGNMTKWFAVGRSSSPYLRIVDANDGSVSEPTVQPGADVRCLDFDSLGQRLAVGTSTAASDELTVYNTNGFSVETSIEISNPVYSASFSRDGDYLAVGLPSGLGGLDIYETSTWSILAGIPAIPGTALFLDWSHDGNWLAVAHTGAPYLTVVNTADWSVVSGTPTLEGTGNGVSFSPDDSLLAVAHAGAPSLTVLNTSDWSQITVGSLGIILSASDGESVDFSPDGVWLLAGFLTSNRSGLVGFPVPSFSTNSAGRGSPYVGANCIECRFSRNGNAFAAVGNGSVIGLTKSQKIGFAPDFDLGSIASSSITTVAVY